MSFDTIEISNSSGRPAFFYEFRWGNTIWYYTSAERELTPDGAQSYEPVAIRHDRVRVGGRDPTSFSITCASNLPVVDLFRGTPPSENVRVVVLSQHVGDAEMRVVFTGKIDNVKRKGAEAELICSPGKQKRGGLRLTWSRTCPHVLYDGQCALDMEDFGLVAEVASVSGNTFTVTEAPHETQGWFDGGIVEWDADGEGTLERRAIERGISTTEFIVFGRADGLEEGVTVTLYPGCDRLPATCNDKFNNLVNFGGIAQMPGESPFGQNIF